MPNVAYYYVIGVMLIYFSFWSSISVNNSRIFCMLLSMSSACCFRYISVCNVIAISFRRLLISHNIFNNASFSGTLIVITRLHPSSERLCLHGY